MSGTLLVGSCGGGARRTKIPIRMKRFICASVVWSLIFLPISAPAVSLSGIILYAAYFDGFPNGEATDPTRLVAFLWHTAPNPEWFGLGVWPGLPPDSLRLQPLNAPNFLLEFRLADGENDFTLLGEPPYTTDALYTHYVVDLFFDGATAGPPGMSVLFPRNSPLDGASIAPNPSAWIYNLPLQSLDVRPPPRVYDDGISRVSIVGASFLPAYRYSSDPESQPNLVVGHAFVLNGAAIGVHNEKDMIGVLKVMVEPSTSPRRGIESGGCAINLSETGTSSLSWMFVGLSAAFWFVVTGVRSSANNVAPTSPQPSPS